MACAGNEGISSTPMGIGPLLGSHDRQQVMEKEKRMTGTSTRRRPGD